MQESQQGSPRRERRHFSAAQKVAIVKAHLVDNVPLSQLCEEHQIQVTQFYQWQKQLFERAAPAFEPQGKKSLPTAEQRKIEQLEAKLIKKNEVIAELLEENVKVKKECGEL